jgi:hypothetical protein
MLQFLPLYHSRFLVPCVYRRNICMRYVFSLIIIVNKIRHAIVEVLLLLRTSVLLHIRSTNHAKFRVSFLSTIGVRRESKVSTKTWCATSFPRNMTEALTNHAYVPLALHLTRAFPRNMTETPTNHVALHLTRALLLFHCTNFLFVFGWHTRNNGIFQGIW